MNARSFFERFLKPNFEEWSRDRNDERLAMNAVLSANQLADWYHHDSKGAMGHNAKWRIVAELRGHLVESECKDFQVIWDVAEAHKHFELSRGNASVKGASQTRIGTIGWGEGRWGEGPYGGGAQLLVHYEDGRKLNLFGATRNVVAMWDRLTSKSEELQETVQVTPLIV